MRFIQIFICLLACACADTEKPVASIVIDDVTVIDPIAGAQTAMSVFIADDKIVQVASTANDDARFKRDASTTVINGEGKYLIPGLWDAHVHLTFTPGLDHEVFFPLSLSYGVTSLRDIGGRLEALAPARRAAGADQLTPDLYVSGPLIDGRQQIYDGRSQFYPDLSVGAATTEDAVRIVDELAAADVDFLKAYEMLSEDVFNAIIDRAETHDLKVAAHVPLSMTAIEAAQSGAADFQHMRNLEMDCAEDPEALLSQRKLLMEKNAAAHAGALRANIHRSQRAAALSTQSDQSCDLLVEQLAANSVFQTPTLTITRFLTRRLFADEAWRATYAYLPQEIEGAWRARSIALADREVSEEAQAFDAWIQGMLRRLNAAGVPILAGTDAPIGFLTPGASLHEELKLLVNAGLTPLEAIRAATIAPAAFMGLENETGAVRAGMAADLVLLTGNPLADISNTTAIDMVIKDGVMLDKTALQELRRRSSN